MAGDENHPVAQTEGHQRSENRGFWEGREAEREAFEGGIAEDRKWREGVKRAREGYPVALSERALDGPRAQKPRFRSRVAEKAAQAEFAEWFPPSER